eukprot:9499288-Pyramimonas_sp.AAC.1
MGTCGGSWPLAQAARRPLSNLGFGAVLGLMPARTFLARMANLACRLCRRADTNCAQALSFLFLLSLSLSCLLYTSDAADDTPC